MMAQCGVHLRSKPQKLVCFVCESALWSNVRQRRRGENWRKNSVKETGKEHSGCVRQEKRRLV